MFKKDEENVYNLTAELQNYGQQGIFIRLESFAGCQGIPTGALAVHEDITFLADSAPREKQPDGLL